MDNKYDVTIPLEKYDELIKMSVKYGDMIKRLKQIISNTNSLNWSKDDLSLPEDVQILIKDYCCLDYRMKVADLKRELEKKDDKQK